MDLLSYGLDLVQAGKINLVRCAVCGTKEAILEFADIDSYNEYEDEYEDEYQDDDEYEDEDVTLCKYFCYNCESTFHTTGVLSDSVLPLTKIEYELLKKLGNADEDEYSYFELVEIEQSVICEGRVVTPVIFKFNDSVYRFNLNGGKDNNDLCEFMDYKEYLDWGDVPMAVKVEFMNVEERKWYFIGNESDCVHLGMFKNEKST